MRQTIHLDFDGDGDLLLDFFRGTPGPLRDYLHIVVGNVGVRLHRQIVERDQAPDEQQQRQR